MKVIVEIRAAEGGDDAKGLVTEQFSVYARLAQRRGVSLEILEERPGFLCFAASGPSAEETFASESGGHRWQRVPPNERRGRVHTSTVTVAVLPEPPVTTVVFDEKDLEITTTRGSGAGGQNRNKVETCVVVKHIPSGIMVRAESERSQHQNKVSALSRLRAELWRQKTREGAASRAKDRKAQVGSGMRGDKRRTIRVQDGQVNDHVDGRSWRLKEYLRGEW